MGKLISEGKLPEWAHIVLDEAYTCSDNTLSPWRGRDLSTAQDAFNYYLVVMNWKKSSQHGVIAAHEVQWCDELLEIIVAIDLLAISCTACFVIPRMMESIM
eukprot:gene25304-31745_t